VNIRSYSLGKSVLNPEDDLADARKAFESLASGVTEETLMARRCDGSGRLLRAGS
jgi:hypothetical protein